MYIFIYLYIYVFVCTGYTVASVDWVEDVPETVQALQREERALGRLVRAKADALLAKIPPQYRAQVKQSCFSM
jgi:ABC-type nitrate/sulfonate/bicarbonate transport system substrate-binding protein